MAGNLRYSTKLSEINYMEISCKKFSPLSLAIQNYNVIQKIHRNNPKTAWKKILKITRQTREVKKNIG